MVGGGPKRQKKSKCRSAKVDRDDNKGLRRDGDRKVESSKGLKEGSHGTERGNKKVGKDRGSEVDGWMGDGSVRRVTEVRVGRETRGRVEFEA